MLSKAFMFSPDRKICAGVIFDEVTPTARGTLKLWDAGTGAELRVLGNKDARYVKYLAFSPDGKTLAAGDEDDSEVNLWNVSTGVELRKFTGDVKGLAFSPDGKILAVAGWLNGVKLWDVSTGALVRTLMNERSFEIAFSPDGKTLFVGGIDEAKLWDVGKGVELRTLRRHANYTGAVSFSPDGKNLVFGGPLALWELSAGAAPRVLSAYPAEAIAFSPDGKTLSVTDDIEVSVLDAGTGSMLRTNKGLFKLEEHQMLNARAFSLDGKTFAAGSTDGTIKLGDAGTELRAFRLHRIDPEFSKDFGEYPAINALAFSPDGKTLAIGDAFGTVTLRDVDTGAEFRTFKVPDRFVAALAFSPDGKALAGIDEVYGEINLWEVSTSRLLRTFKTEQHIFAKIAFSPDGKILVAKAGNTGAGLWDVATGGELHTLKGPVDYFAFSPDGRTLAVSELGTGKLKLWDTASGQELATLISIDKKDWMVVTPDGLFDGSPAAWNLLLWRFKQNTFAPLEAFFSEFYYPGLLADIMAGKRPKTIQSIAEKDRRQPIVQLALAQSQASAASAITARNIALKLDLSEIPADKDHNTGSGAKDARLFRNGSLVKVWHGDVLMGRNSVSLEATVPIVAGENRFTAYAFNNDNVKSSDEELVVNGADSLKRSGTAYILAVGINTYSNSEYNLKYAVADAEDFSAEVKRQQESLKRYAQVEVTSLSDNEATKANIMQRLARLAARVQPEDAVIVYFAGHGTAHGNQFYLIPHDLGYDGPRTNLNEAGLRAILAHSISDKELEKVFEGIDAGGILLVIDACNSGQALEAEEKRRGPMNSKGLAQLAYEKGMYVLTAAQSYQAAQEAAKFGHGFLTYALVEEGLKQGAADREPKDGTINLREWLNYATQQVPRMQEENMLEALRGRGRDIPFAQGEGDVKDPSKRSVQRPRIFYRRELELQPLVVAMVGASPRQ